MNILKINETLNKRNMETDFIVWGEMQASRLLMGKVEGYELATTRKSAHEAGNYIIQLAEKIKAERAAAAMIK